MFSFCICRSNQCVLFQSDPNDDEGSLPGPEPDDNLAPSVSVSDKKRPSNGSLVAGGKSRPPPLVMPGTRAAADKDTVSLASLWRVASRSSLSSTVDFVKDKIVVSFIVDDISHSMVHGQRCPPGGVNDCNKCFSWPCRLRSRINQRK